jgi:hypothetical protein
MIDFTDIIRVQSEKLNSPENTILKSKVLQLSVSARNELKSKIKEYYCRIPKEDESIE